TLAVLTRERVERPDLAQLSCFDRTLSGSSRTAVVSLALDALGHGRDAANARAERYNPSAAEPTPQRQHVRDVLLRLRQHPDPPHRREPLVVARGGQRRVAAGLAKQPAEVEHAGADVVDRIV